MNEVALNCRDLAVIGMACRFPGSEDYPAFWTHLWEGDNLIREIPPDRPALAKVYSPDIDLPGGSISKWGGFLDRIDGFDHRFFNISPREARNMDPQQRLLLEEAWHCLEDAAVPLERLQQTRTAVFVGAMSIDYYQEMLAADVETDGYACSGNFSCILANRLSYFFGFRGASMALDTACSSSLVALHEARQSILSGASDYAVVAGVSLNFNPWKYVSFSKARMLSPEGQCKAFARDANGYVPGEGVGVILVQPLERARAEGRRIHAIIKGSAVNHGGEANSLTAPRVQAQCDVVLEALASAQISADSITYIEAHGTGTSLGDPIEIEALTQAFARHTRSRQFCRIGSLKSNIGHLEAAAGLAGLIKVILMLKHRAIPATLNIQTPSPLIAFQNSPFQLADRRIPWEGRPELLRAGVSSFGFGGVNSHVIVESAPPHSRSPNQTSPAQAGPAPGEPFPLLLSAKSATSLEKLLARWSEHLQTPDYSEQKLKDICLTLLHGRESFAHRFGACVVSKSELEEALAARPEKAPMAGPVRGWRLILADPAPLSLWPESARPPFQDEAFEETWMQCEEAFRKLTPDSAHSPADREPAVLSPAIGRRLRQLSRVMAAFRILSKFLGTPREIALEAGALPAGFHLTEALTLDQAVAWTAERAVPPQRLRFPRIALVNPATGGVLPPFSITADYLQSLVKGIDVDPETTPAIFNQARQLFETQFTFRRYLEAWDEALRPVHGGIQELLAKADGQNPHAERKVGKTILLIAVLESWQKLNRKWELTPADNLVGQQPQEIIDLLSDGILERAEVLRLLADPVRHSSSLAASANSRLALLDHRHAYPLLRSLHAGEMVISNWAEWWGQLPGQISEADDPDFAITLSFGGLTSQGGTSGGLNDAPRSGLGKHFHWGLDNGTEKRFLNLLVECWLAGANVNWRAYRPADSFCILSLPRYPFDQESFWIREQNRPVNDVSASAASSHAEPRQTQLASTPFAVDSTPLLADHRIGGKILVPAALLMEMALARSQAPSRVGSRGISNFSILQPALLQSGQIAQFDLQEEQSRFVVRMGPVTLARGRLDPRTESPARRSLEAYFMQPALAGETLYRELAERGYGYGPACRFIQCAWRNEDGMVFKLKAATLEENHPSTCQACLLDGALQSVLAAVPFFFPDLKILLLPYEIESVRQFSPLPNECFAWVERRSLRPENGGVTAAVGLFDSKGTPHLEIEGLCCKRPLWLSPARASEVSREGTRLRAGDEAPREGTRPTGGDRRPGLPTRREEFEKIEGELIDVVAEILRARKSEIHRQTDLREYGLDSIALTELAEALSARLEFTIDPTDLFEYPSIEALARYLGGHLPKVPASDDAEVRREQPASAKAGEPLAEAEKDLDFPGRAAGGDLEIKPRTVRIGPEPVVDPAAVAVIGMAGRFPKAGNLRAFWENLVRGEDCISEFPAEQWRGEESWSGPDGAAHRAQCKWGGFLNDVDQFDPSFFRISPKEAALMDPQQRLVLETSWHALEDAGLKVSALNESLTGVFIGVCNHDYRELVEKYSREHDPQSATGTYFSIIANRVSYIFNFRGPSVAIDTACSSSLVAVHQAVRALRDGECDLALSGGVNVCCTPRLFLAFTEAGMLSEDGRCKTFDKRANGYVRGEGVGMVVLKRMADALRDGDTIYGVILGTAVNHGGLANSLTAPNPIAQAALLGKVYTEAQVPPDTVSYIEVHGTGTELGDPIEIAGLKKAFAELALELGSAPGRKNYCGLGSVKTNIGHLESAAGIAGLIKVLLALEARTLPATIHYQELNPHIDLQGTPFRIVSQTERWDPLLDAAGKPFPRRAGVSSFGFGGTNAHVVLEEFPMPEPVSAAENATAETIVLSARTEDCLRAAATELVNFLTASPRTGRRLADLAYTLQSGREEFDWRLAILARTWNELKEKLEGYVADRRNGGGILFGGAGLPKFSHGRLGDGSVDRGFIKTLFGAGQLERIAGFWVSGSRIHWDELYPPQGRRRVSLPGYSFSRERHWIGPLPSGETSQTDGVRSDAMRERLFQLFGETLQMKRERLDPDALFGDFGVDSALMAELVRKIERMIGAAFDPSLLLQFPTINELSARLEQRGGALVPSSHGGNGKPEAETERPATQGEGNGTVKPAGSSDEIQHLRSPALAEDRWVAVIGIGCRVPGADQKDAFWEQLRSGKSGLREVPPDRWDVDRFYSAVPRRGMSISKWGGFLEGIDLFDPEYFNISEADALEMDPLARLFLEVSMQTLCDAGYTKEELWNTPTGVFVGSRASSYASRLAEFSKYTPIGTGQNFIAAQLSHFLDLKGPNLIVDTACSSSLVSVHLACQSLLSGDCDLAIAGGVDLLLDENIYLILSEAKALSRDGRCHTFDLRANGYVPGEGCGAVLLKPFRKALGDGDRIYAVIAGSAINNDGHTMGITTPNLEAQEAVIVAALDRAHVQPETVGYVEAHGTGTMIGDPIELKALTRAFRRYTQARQFCAVGSVKTNVGHLHSAAGIASFIKVALALHHREIPPTLNCEEPNPRFEFSESPFYPNLHLQPWQPRDKVRRSGISSFGFGGTNCHLIAEAFVPENFREYECRRKERPPPAFKRKKYWLPKPGEAAPGEAPIGSGARALDRLVTGEGILERRRPPPLLVLEEIATAEPDPFA